MRFPIKVVRELRASGFATPAPELLDALGVGGTYAGERVTPQKMIQEAAVYSAVRQISEAIGQSPLGVYRTLDDDEREEARSHRAWRLLHDKPNPISTAHEFWAAVATHLLVYENAFIAKEAPDQFSPVESLWLLDPDSITVEWNGRQKRFVQYTPQKRVYTAEDVLHIPGFSMDGVVGTPRATLCRQTLATALARAKFEGTFYSRGAKVSGIIHHPGRLGDAGVRRLSNTFQQWHSGQHHGVPVLEEGAHFDSQTMSMADMQFVELRQLSLSEIAVMFQMPPAYLGASTGDSLTYATTESNQIQFATQAVIPLANRIALAVSNDPELLPQNVMYARFNTDGLYVPDAKSRAERDKILYDMNVITREWIASRENLPAPPPEKKPEPVPPAAPDPAQNGNGNGLPTRAVSL